MDRIESLGFALVTACAVIVVPLVVSGLARLDARTPTRPPHHVLHDDVRRRDADQRAPRPLDVPGVRGNGRRRVLQRREYVPRWDYAARLSRRHVSTAERWMVLYTAR